MVSRSASIFASIRWVIFPVRCLIPALRANVAGSNPMTITLIVTDRYSSDLNLLNLVSAAQSAIDNFEQSPKSGSWLFLQQVNIIQDMRIRIADPFQVNQR